MDELQNANALSNGMLILTLSVKKKLHLPKDRQCLGGWRLTSLTRPGVGQGGGAMARMQSFGTAGHT